MKGKEAIVSDLQDIASVENSYSECLKEKEFFGRFYKCFLEKDPRIPELFKDTDFERQHKVLRDSLAYLIMYGEGSRIASTKIEDLGVKHGRDHLNIPPDLYVHWLEALLETVKSCDPNWDDDLKRKWKYILSLGIVKIKSYY